MLRKIRSLEGLLRVLNLKHQMIVIDLYYTSSETQTDMIQYILQSIPLIHFRWFSHSAILRPRQLLEDYSRVQ